MTIRKLLLLAALLLAPSSLTYAAPETCITGGGLATTPKGIPDRDGDGVSDAIDNCLEVFNADQLDADSDGFGNRCDADLNNDGVTNVVDLGILRDALFEDPGDPQYASADLNGDGAINVTDVGIMRGVFFEPPGPQGLCADGVSCAGPVDFGLDSNGQISALPVVDFVFRTNDPEIIYHARRLISGASQCNPNLESRLVPVSEPYNPLWSFSAVDDYVFFGGPSEPREVCDASPSVIEMDFTNWCTDSGGGSSIIGGATCDVWCPWFSEVIVEF